MKILVLDGHDATGKTSIAQGLAARCGWTYVKPFHGSLGEMLTWCYAKRRFDLNDQLARAAIERAIDEALARSGGEAAAGGPALVFDRHWLSLFTYLPRSLFQNWMPLPRTVLCWADLETTCRRLEARGEAVGDLEEHRHFLRLYRELAGEFGVPVLDTSAMTVDEAVERVAAELSP